MLHNNNLFGLITCPRLAIAKEEKIILFGWANLLLSLSYSVLCFYRNTFCLLLKTIEKKTILIIWWEKKGYYSWAKGT